MLDVFNASFHQCIENFYLQFQKYFLYSLYALWTQSMILPILCSNNAYPTLYNSFNRCIAPIFIKPGPLCRWYLSLSLEFPVIVLSERPRLINAVVSQSSIQLLHQFSLYKMNSHLFCVLVFFSTKKWCRASNRISVCRITVVMTVFS